MNRKQGVGMENSSYREFRPPPALAEYLLCFWAQTTSLNCEVRQRVLPDCCVDILVLNGVPVVVGPWTEPFVSPLPPGTKILGARCHPGLASELLGMPASELLNRSVPLCDVWGRADCGPLEGINDNTTTLSEGMLAMQVVLRRRMANARPVDRATRAAVRWLAQRPHARVEQVSDRLGMSPRQLQRRFVASAGYGPKMFQCVFRFQRLLNEASRTGGLRSLAELAIDAGYSDQAHMTREVQRFAGYAPASFLRSASSTLCMSDLFNTGNAGAIYG